MLRAEKILVSSIALVTLAYDLIDWEKLAVDVWLMFVMGFLIAQDLISVPLLPSLVLSKYLALNAKGC